MKLQHIAAAAALLVAGAANASLADFTTGNSSVGFLAYNTTATNSVFIDLGVNLKDFIPAVYSAGGSAGTFAQGALSQDNVTAVWNFATNTFTLNGVAQTTQTNSWGAYGSFLADLAANNVTGQNWAVIAGDNTVGNTDGAPHYLTTGTPSTTQLNSQGSSQTANMQLVNALYQAEAPLLGSADNGSYFTTDTANSGYVLNTALFGTNWATNLKWASTTTNSVNNFWLNIGDGTEYAVGKSTDPAAVTTGLLNAKGTWTLNASAQTLTWQTATVTASVPEPESYALALVGLAAVGFIARRRAAK